MCIKSSSRDPMWPSGLEILSLSEDFPSFKNPSTSEVSLLSFSIVVPSSMPCDDSFDFLLVNFSSLNFS